MYTVTNWYHYWWLVTDIYQPVQSIYRQRKKIFPGRELALTTIVVGSCIFGVYGLVIPVLTTYQVLFALGYSSLFTLAIDFPKYEAFKKFGL